MNVLPRREFLKDSALAAAAYATSVSAARAASGTKPPALRLGVIGCGWWGMLNMRKAFDVGGVECVALCDVDTAHLRTAADQVAERQGGRRPRLFRDFHRLLQIDELDAVIIGTPPHWHALPFIAACERGLAIYCEKPLAYDVRESRAMVEAAKKHGVIVQIGFQRRNSRLYNEVRQYIRDGNIGRVVNVEARINRKIRLNDPTPVDPPPTLDWEMWCGPAPLLPYSEQVGHFSWRYEKTTGNGHLVDWGIHLVDVTRWVLGAPAPKSVTAAGGIYALEGRITTPDVLAAQFDFDGVPLQWNHRIWGGADANPETSYGTTFYGEKATLFVTEKKWWTIANEKGAQPEVRELAHDAHLAHMQDFLGAVRERRQAACLPEDAHFSTAAVALAMVAYEAGRTLKWDPEKEEVLGDPGLAAMIKRDYRAPWVHPWTD